MSDVEYGNNAELEAKKMDFKKVFEQGLERLRTTNYTDDELRGTKDGLSDFGKDI